VSDWEAGRSEGRGSWGGWRLLRGAGQQAPEGEGIVERFGSGIFIFSFFAVSGGIWQISHSLQYWGHSLHSSLPCPFPPHPKADRHSHTHAHMQTHRKLRSGQRCCQSISFHQKEFTS